MRKITEQAINALYAAKPFKNGNTEIRVLPNVTVMLLHGNEIAYLYNDPEKTLSITNCGWESTVTKERLNGLNGVDIYQLNFKWYLNGNEWDGELIDVKQ